MANQEWIEHAYPLQQITIKLQGTRHSEREAITGQLETITARLRAGDINGTDHDDDYGYSFVANESVKGPSFFEEPCASR